MKLYQLSGILLLGAAAGTASAQLTSPLTGADYSPYGITATGGVVIDIVGTSGTQVVSQIAADSLFNGFYDSVWNGLFGFPGPDAWIPDSTMGIGGGFASVLSELGGGISSMAIRLTEWDGDTGTGGVGVNSYNPAVDPSAAGIDLLVNGIKVADFEDVGFDSGVLETDFFIVTDPSVLASVFASITDEIVLGYFEGDDKGSAEVNFVEGLDGAALTTSVDPTVVVPEPSVLGLLGFASVLGLVTLRRRR